MCKRSPAPHYFDNNVRVDVAMVDADEEIESGEKLGQERERIVNGNNHSFNFYSKLIKITKKTHFIELTSFCN